MFQPRHPALRFLAFAEFELVDELHQGDRPAQVEGEGLVVVTHREHRRVRAQIRLNLGHDLLAALQLAVAVMAGGGDADGEQVAEGQPAQRGQLALAAQQAPGGDGAAQEQQRRDGDEMGEAVQHR